MLDADRGGGSRQRESVATRYAPIALAIVVVVAGLIAGGVYDWPRDVFRVRVTRTSGPASHGQTMAVEYCRPIGGPMAAHAGNRHETVRVPFTTEGGALVADVPRTRSFVYAGYTLCKIAVDGVDVMFVGPSDADADAEGVAEGVVSAHVTLADTPGFFMVEPRWTRELDIQIDDRPLMTTTLEPPELPIVVRPEHDEDEESDEDRDERPQTDAEIDAEIALQMQVTRIGTDPQDLPLVSVCGGGHVTLTFDIHPWPAQQSDIQAVLTESGRLRRLTESHYEGTFRPEHELPVTLTRDEWRETLADDATRDGYVGGTPTLTLARGDHTATLWAPQGDGFGEPGFREGIVWVGVFGEGQTSAVVGAVRVELTRYPCATH